MSKQILIVDDDRDLSRMLRATLELFDRTYKVVETPSAEEALLEAGRTAFDLVIADIRLPGLDGLEMLRRLQKLRPEQQGIIVSGLTEPARPEEIQDLRLAAIFVKPISTDELIAAVRKVLGSGNRPTPRAEDVLAYAPSLGDRLSALRRDLGALAIYLGDLNGRVLARAGDISAFDVDTLLRHIETAFSASLKVSNLLGGLVSQNMHFFDGDEYDVYVLNVGLSYMLVMLFPGDIGSRQMGQVSRYGRQAADDMLNALADIPAYSRYAAAEQAPGVAPQPIVVPTYELVSPDLPEPIVLTPASDLVLEPPAAPEPEPVQLLDINFETLGATAPAVAGADLDSFWDDALTRQEAPSQSHGNDLSFEQALQLGLVAKNEPKGA